MPAIEIPSLVIGHLKTEILKAIRLQRPDISDNDVMYVIAVPAIWSDAAKQLMREAATSREVGLSTNQQGLGFLKAKMLIYLYLCSAYGLATAVCFYRFQSNVIYLNTCRSKDLLSIYKVFDLSFFCGISEDFCPILLKIPSMLSSIVC